VGQETRAMTSLSCHEPRRLIRLRHRHRCGKTVVSALLVQGLKAATGSRCSAASKDGGDSKPVRRLLGLSEAEAGKGDSCRRP